MTKLVKIVDNKYVQIEEYKNPTICFNTNEYSYFEDYCTLRETFDPFEMFYENQELKKQLEEYKNSQSCSFVNICKNVKIANYNQQKEFIKYLEDGIKQINPKILDDGELNLRLDDIKYTRYLTYKEILQKYKSIIGDDK